MRARPAIESYTSPALHISRVSAFVLPVREVDGGYADLNTV
jgi:hypothetical protein